MSTLGELSIEEVEQALLLYLARHPLAADTVEGIVQWWLPELRYRCSVGLALQVLERLVQRGILRKRSVSGQQDVYFRPDASTMH
jgi:hypothetical protein